MNYSNQKDPLNNLLLLLFLSDNTCFRVLRL